MATWRRTSYLPAAHFRIQCHITPAALGRGSRSSIPSPPFPLCPSGASPRRHGVRAQATPTLLLVLHGCQASLVLHVRKASKWAVTTMRKDVIHLLDNVEALEFVQYDPSVQDETVWEASETINTFLERHFLHPLAPD